MFISRHKTPFAPVLVGSSSPSFSHTLIYIFRFSADSSKMLFATLTLLVAALAPSVAGQAPKGAKISAKDHHDYGDQKDGWHWWDKEHFWKPVVCAGIAPYASIVVRR